MFDFCNMFDSLRRSLQKVTIIRYVLTDDMCEHGRTGRILPEMFCLGRIDDTLQQLIALD